MNDANILKLRIHNQESYKKIVEQFKKDKVAAIVHATGTGKSYNALQLAFDNKDKKTTIIVPSIAAKNHILDIISDNPDLNMERDFPNLNIITYQSLITKRDKELSELKIDYLILDEFHHIGAPVWGEKVNKIVEFHPNMKVLGMTAYNVRDRGTSYERDMTNPKTEELFSGKVVSRYDLYDAILDGVLPLPQYISTNIDLESDIEELSDTIENNNKLTTEQKREYQKVLSDCRDTISHHPIAQELLVNNLNNGDKCIYFCPLHDGEIKNENDEFVDNNEITSIQGLVSLKLSKNRKDVVSYITTSDYGKFGIEEQDKFYNDKGHFNNEDVSNKLMIMFAKNQYNEAVHARRVNKVVLARRTNSDIVFFEQVGRCLSVGGNKSPLIIDLAGNIEFIKELKDNLKNRVREREERGIYSSLTKEMIEHNFTITVLYEKIIDVLNDIRARINLTFEEKMIEYLDAMLANGNKLISGTSQLQFSDGTQMRLYWNHYKTKICNLVQSKPYDEKYSECIKTIFDEYQDYLKSKDNQLSDEEKIIEYLDAMLANGNKLIFGTGQLQFSDGTQMRSYWDRNKTKIYNLVKSKTYDEKYSECIKTICFKYEHQLSDEEKLIEYLDAMLANGNKLISGTSQLQFSDGTRMLSYWNHYKTKIYNLVQSKPYDEKYSECIKTICFKYENQLSDEEKLIEYLDAMLANGNKLISVTSQLQFSDGTQMNQYWGHHKTKIYNLVKSKTYDEKYSECIKTICFKCEHQLSDEEKLIEYLDAMLANGNKLISGTSQLQFSDGTRMRLYWREYKIKLYNLVKSKTYGEKYSECIKTIIDEYQDYLKSKEHQLSVEEKLIEYLDAMLANGNKLIPVTSRLQFSDGTQMNQYWSRYRTKIYNSVQSKPYDEKYSECIKTIIDKYHVFKITEKNQDDIKENMLEYLEYVLSNYESDKLPDKEKLNMDMIDKLSR